ncbi:hypothetical protein AZKH_2552 [Azoarcus sp. KH32C]|nr:hypothetical protein AZKH_2552 [Azoarcus sp. KH32C]
MRHANRHSALSYEHAEKIEAQLKAEVQEMLRLAEAADQSRRARRRACALPQIDSTFRVRDDIQAKKTSGRRREHPEGKGVDLSPGTSVSPRGARPD